MKSFAKKLVLVFALLSFLSLGCASAKKTVAKGQKPAESAAKDSKATQVAVNTKEAGKPAAQDTKTVKTDTQVSAVTKSTAQDKVMDEMIKKYSTPKQVDSGPRAAPDFNLQDINYDTYRLSSYKGQQPVLLFFWATWCDYCKSEVLMLHNRYPQLVQDGLEVLAIDTGESMEKVSDFIRDRGIGLKVLVDTDTSVAVSYRSMGVPTYVLVDINGNIVFQDNIFPDAYKSLLSGK